MPRADLVLVVDQKWRDLPGMVALALWLEQTHRLTTALIPYWRWRESLILRRPRAIVVSHMNGPRNRAIAQTAHRLGTRVAVIQTEGRPNNVELMEYAVGRAIDARAVDLWFTWSDTVRDHMVEHRVLPPNRVVVAGVHRFDVYRPPLSALIVSREDFAAKYGLDPSRPIVSLATNFTCTKYHRRNQRFLEKDWRSLGLARLPSYSNPREFARLDWEARERTLGLVKTLLLARPHLQLILKPHPTEEHERYQAFVGECVAELGPRVAFIGAEYIWDVLNAADVHLHRMCTTGIEAWLLDVPTVDVHVLDYYGWSLDVRGAAAEAAAGDDLVREADELIERVDHYLGGGAPTAAQLAARHDYIRRWLDRVDGRRCEAHAQHLANLLADWTRPAGGGSLADRLRVVTRGALRGLGLDAPRRFTGVNGAVDRLGQVDCRITEHDVAAWRARVRPILLPNLERSVPYTVGRQ